jgi:endo-1,4-beta-xylanase
MTNRKLITRRNAIYLGLGTAASIGASQLTTKLSPQIDSLALDRQPQREFKVTGTGTLRQRAARKGIIYGADCGSLELESQPPLQRLVTRECAMLVPGFLKWDHLRPSPTSFYFDKGDWYVNFARKNQLLVRGHTLAWHEALPPWFKETVNSQNARQFLADHIQKVVGHYAGKMHSWDVVNEAILVENGHPRGLRKTPWLDLLGEDYIELAFRLAAKADPQALLTYNDYGLDYDRPEDDAKRTAVLKLLERLKSKGIPIQAFGMQSHLFAGEYKFNPQKLRKFLGDVANLGLKILITEMDVSDRKLPSDVKTRDRLVAGAYEDYLAAALDEKAVISVITWGLSDRYTWLAVSEKRKDGSEVRPLPFDRDLQRKLAWNGIARAFDRAPKR